MKKKQLLKKIIIFIKDKILTHNMYKVCPIFLMKTPNLQTKITSQNCKRVKQSYNLYKIYSQTAKYKI
jgi:hypothetical protein